MISVQIIWLNKNRPELADGTYSSNWRKMKISGSEKHQNLLIFANWKKSATLASWACARR
jgi:hypothetical protein